MLAAAAVCDSESKSLQPAAERAAAKSLSLPTERSRGPRQMIVNKLVNLGMFSFFVQAKHCKLAGFFRVFFFLWVGQTVFLHAISSRGDAN